jgi:hypothetical protein
MQELDSRDKIVAGLQLAGLKLQRSSKLGLG